jgi:hypothetical protein
MAPIKTKSPRLWQIHRLMKMYTNLYSVTDLFIRNLAVQVFDAISVILWFMALTLGTYLIAYTVTMITATTSLFGLYQGKQILFPMACFSKEIMC